MFTVFWRWPHVTTALGSTLSTWNLGHTCKLPPPIVKNENSHDTVHRRRLSDCLLRSALSMLKTCHTRESKCEWKRVLSMSMPTSNTFLAKLHISLKPMLSSVTANRSLLFGSQSRERLDVSQTPSYVHSLFARLVSDTGTLTQYLYSTKGIWRHLTGRFCFLGRLNRTLGRGRDVRYCVCWGQR